MAKEVIYLKAPKNQDFLFWTVCSQCQFLGTVVIRDDQTVYTVIRKVSPSTDVQVLEQSSRQYLGTSGLRVEIDVPVANHLWIASKEGTPISAEGIGIGNFYNLCIEDSYDRDYNDFYINIVAWHKKG